MASFLVGVSERVAPADLVRRPEIAQSLLDELPLAIFWKDRDSRFIGANQKALDYLGLSLGQLVGRRYEDLFAVEDGVCVYSVDQGIMATGIGLRGTEEYLSNSKGELSAVRVTKLPIMDEFDRAVGMVGFFHDIAEEERVFAELKTSEMRYSLAVGASRDGIWDLDMKRGEFFMSQRCRELLGIPEGIEPVTWLGVARVLGIEQVRLIAGAIKKAIPDNSPMMSIELRTVKADGSTRWLNLVGAPLKTEEGFDRIVGALEDVTAERERESQLVYKATHDLLTDLPNRVALIERLEIELASNRDFDLLVIDIDQFRLTNDSLGREIGDQVLLATGNRIADFVGPAGFVARSGGDDFAVLLNDSSHAETVAEFLTGILCQPIEVADLELFVSTTIGVVGRGEAHNTPVDMLRDAENVLYRAKQIGKGSYCIFQPYMHQEAEDELALQARIRRAVREEEFELYYQPLISAADRKMVGVEALIRWRPDGPDGLLIPPDVFLPYLENSGLITSVGRWIIDQACRQLAQWRQDDIRMNEVSMSVNVSRVQFQGRQLERHVQESLTRHRIPAGDLFVEVTETSVALSADGLIEQLSAIRGSGVRIVLDDFGVGHSSLSTLYNLPVDAVKIDRSFVDRIRLDKREPVTEAALEIARSMGLRTVAEGVETADQASWLSSSGCNVLQGFLFARPVPHTEVVGYLDP